MRYEDFREGSKDPNPISDVPAYELAVQPENSGKPYAEITPSSMNIDLLQYNLMNCLIIIDDEVMKDYITQLDQLPIIKPETYISENLQDIHFFRISELVYQEDEFSVDKFAMIFQTLSNRPCTIVLLVKSDGEQTNFYLGARPNSSYSSGTLFQMLKQSLMGFFPGSRVSEYYDEDMKKDMNSLEPGCISIVTSVADYKQSQESLNNKDFMQGLEKFVYAMQGKSYTAIFLADNVDHDELTGLKREYEQIYTQISPFVNMQLNFSVSDGSSTATGSSEGLTQSTSHTQSSGTSETLTDTESQSSGETETVGNTDTDTHGQSESTADGKTHTVGTSDGTSNTVTAGTSVGTYGGVSSHAGLTLGPFSIGGGKNLGMIASKTLSIAHGTSHTDSISDSISKTLTHGISESSSHSSSKTQGFNESRGESHSRGASTSNSEADTRAESFNFVNTQTLTNTFGSSQGITLNAKNMTLDLILQKVEKQLKRIEECESFGMWNYATYFLGETASEAETAANTYKSVIAGSNSGIERSAVNSWTDEDSLRCLYGYIKNFVHPHFVYSGFSYDEERYIDVNPSALVSTNELAIHMGLPRHSVKGLPVVEHAQFAQEVITKRKSSDKTIKLGNIYHLGKKTNTVVELDLDSLSMHTFITGSTGSGKSNAVYHMLSEIRRKGLSFLVVEPAKGEYKNVFPDVRCFGTNPRNGEILKINPFSFPDEVHVLEHIDRIIEIFNVCWPMYAAMPAVLKDSIEQAYISAGWDLDLSENVKVPGLYPTFDDVLRELNLVIQYSEYSADTKGDYIGSLSTRIKSLTNGINGRIFASDEIPLGELFDNSAIIDISHVGAAETKSLIMGLVVLKLQEYRMSKAEDMNAPLKHITVLEEAHNLLKKTSTEQSAESSNMVGKSVEMLTNAIAEIRTYGEGFVIVDQAPNLLDTSAIRNTNTKVVMRLPESTDREITGGAIALKEQQFDELSKLPTGVAAVYQNDWQESVLCSLPKYEILDFRIQKREVLPAIYARKKENDLLLHMLLKINLTEAECQEVIRRIMNSNVSAKIKKDLILNIGKNNRIYEWAIADFIHKNYDFIDVFRGTSKCADLEQLYSIMKQNILDEFSDFSEKELFSIMYYICRIEHEKHPENSAIELLRTQYLRERVI